MVPGMAILPVVHGTPAGPDRTTQVKTALLGWYAANKRDLPWRSTRDPYAILVAELMLQQTQVERVIPKWHAWLQHFPTLTDLAQASKADAVRAWQGLGYNLRALRLHAIACQVVAEHGGALPGSVEGLLALKGVGRYTAGAVACFAYEQPVAMVDTNIRRVLSRVFRVQPVDVEELAAQIVPPESAYAWHQALMDLGATLCRARRPLCLACPLVSQCDGPGLQASPATRSVAEFRGSRRFYRGRLVEALRGVPGGMSMQALALAVGGAAEHARMVDLVHKLVADGLLIVESGQTVRLAE
jgi:A/G-specific adenine glycosylase